MIWSDFQHILFSEKAKYKRHCSVCYLLCKKGEGKSAYTNMFFFFHIKKHRENNRIGNPSFPTKGIREFLGEMENNRVETEKRQNEPRTPS